MGARAAIVSIGYLLDPGVAGRVGESLRRGPAAGLRMPPDGRVVGGVDSIRGHVEIVDQGHARSPYRILSQGEWHSLPSSSQTMTWAHTTGSSIPGGSVIGSMGRMTTGSSASGGMMGS